MVLTIGLTTTNRTRIVRIESTNSSTPRMMSSRVGRKVWTRLNAGAASLASGASANRRFTISIWSPRFASKPTDERTSAAILSSSSWGRG